MLISRNVSDAGFLISL